MFSGRDSYDEWTYDNFLDADLFGAPELDERDRLDITHEEIELERTSLSDIDLILRQGIADGYLAASVLSFLAGVEARHGVRTRSLLADYLIGVGSDSAARVSYVPTSHP